MTRCQETLDYIPGSFMMQNRLKKKQCSKITRYLITFWIFTQHSEHIIHFTSHAVTYANKQKSFTWLICVTGTCLMTKSTLYLYQIVSIYNECVIVVFWMWPPSEANCTLLYNPHHLIWTCFPCHSAKWEQLKD